MYSQERDGKGRFISTNPRSFPMRLTKKERILIEQLRLQEYFSQDPYRFKTKQQALTKARNVCSVFKDGEIMDGMTVTNSNILLTSMEIDYDLVLITSNLTIIDSLVQVGDHSLWLDNMSNITSSGSIGYFDIWRTTNSTDLLVSTILCLPEGYIATIQWKNGTSYYSPWIKTHPTFIQTILDSEIFLVNFTIPKTLYRLPTVELKLTIQNNSIVIWQSQQWQVPVGKMIPNIDLTFPENRRWEGVVSLKWNISESEIDNVTFNLYLYNSTGQFLIAEGVENNEYDFDTTVFSDGHYTFELFVGDFNSTTYEIFIDNINDAPSVSVLSPNSWGSYSELLVIEWNMDDQNEDALTASIYYSVDQVVWYLIKEKVTDLTLSWDISTVADGSYYLKIVVSDGFLEDSQIVRVTIYNPKAPTIQILSPLAEDQLSGNISISWEAYDPNPSDNLKFTVYYSNDNSSWNILVTNIYASEVIWDTTEIESGTYYILVTVFDGINSSTAYTGPIHFKSKATKSSPTLGISTTLLCLGIMTIFLGKKSKNG